MSDSHMTIPVYRFDDHELMGFVTQSSSNEQWIAMTVFNFPLNSFQTKEEAFAFLLERGLQILTEKWEFYSSSDSRWYLCQIIEARPGSVDIGIMDPSHPDFNATICLTFPTYEVLRLVNVI